MKIISQWFTKVSCMCSRAARVEGKFGLVEVLVLMIVDQVSYQVRFSCFCSWNVWCKSVFTLPILPLEMLYRSRQYIEGGRSLSRGFLYLYISSRFIYSMMKKGHLLKYYHSKFLNNDIWVSELKTSYSQNIIWKASQIKPLVGPYVIRNDNYVIPIIIIMLYVQELSTVSKSFRQSLC